MQFPNSLKFANMAAVLTCLLAVTLFIAAPRQAGAQVAQSTVALNSHTPLKVLNGEASRVSHYNPEQKLRLALGVQPPHMAEEEQFIKDLVTKGSPTFHQFLSADEWNARFGPSVADEQAVVDWATSQGLTVTNRYPNRLIVDVEGKAGVIEKAFGVTINNYQVGEEVDFSNDRDPQIPASLSGILHSVLGLNSIERAHRIGSKTKTPKGPDYVAGPASSLAFSGHGNGDPTKTPANRAAANQTGGTMANPTPSDSYPLSSGVMDPDNIQSSEAYDYNALQRLSHCCNEWGDSAGSPPESSIALVGYGNYNYSDATTFFNYYGMAWYLYAYYINGSGFPGVDGEAPLDVEYSGAMSNSYGSYLDTARIYEYEMPNGLYATYADAFEAIDTNNYAKVVSTSYGWEENVGFSGSVATGTMHPIFDTMVGQGRTLIAASGDNGASDGCGDATAVDYPSSDPDFLAAGGTQLLLNSSGIFTSEIAWQGEFNSNSCQTNHGGGTGGVSVLFAAPSWQTATTTAYPDGIAGKFYLWKAGAEYVETGNTYRMVPDISLTANPDVLGEWYYSGGSWQDEGGTSIVAPELAGFFAQENSYLDYIGNRCGSGSSACSPVGLATPLIYYNGLDGAPHNPFYDMTSGCNSNNVTQADDLFYYCAYTGWDPATGWGSANMLQLAWGINWELIPAYGSPSVAFSGPATGSTTWYNTNQQVDWTVSDSGTPTPPGVAGFTQGWDSIPADPGSEPHGGDGNSFYSGPQYSFATSGCLAFTANGCAGNGGAQGCHTVEVRGWDNQGNTAYSTYGPLCYDNVAPTITASTNPVTAYSTWVDKSVVVTLTPADSGGANASGIKTTYYAMNTGNCYPGNLGPCSIYTGPFTISGQQQSYVYYFTVDKAGNYSTEPYIWVSIDLTAPVTTASLSGTVYGGSIYKTAVQVTLNPSDTGGSGVLHTYYQPDGGSTITYGSAFTISALGSHSVKYWSVDNAGNVETAKTVSFSIDSTGALYAPTPGSTLTGTSSTFTWSAGVGVTTYRFRLGTTGVGSSNVYNAAGSTTSALSSPDITGIPAYGAPLYARLCSWISSAWQCNDYTYKESGAPTKAVLTTPTPGSTLSGTSATFSWAAGGGVTYYRFRLGTTGAGSSNVYNAAGSTTTALSSPLITGIPAYGVPLYARLCSWISSTWQCNDYTYTESGSAVKAVLTSPTPGSTLTGSSATFSWTAGGGVTFYRFRLGTTGPGSSNVYNAAGSTTTALTTGVVTGIPTTGGTVYARLSSWIDGAWQNNDYTYTEQ